MAEFPLTNTAQQVDDAIQAVVDAPNNSIASGSTELVTAGTIHQEITTLDASNLDPAFLVTEAEAIDNNDTDTQIPTCAAVKGLVDTTVSTVRINFASYTAASGSIGSSGVIPVTEALDPNNIGSVSSGVVTVGAGTYLVTFSGNFNEGDSSQFDYYFIKLRYNGSDLFTNKIDEDNQIVSGTTIVVSGTSQTLDIFAQEVPSTTLYYQNVSLNILKLA